MANNYNNNPIVLDTDMASGWKSLQALFANAASAVGIRVYKIELVSNGTTVAGTVSIVDPTTNQPLWGPIAVAATAGAAGTVLQREDFAMQMPAFRDFKVTGLTATVTKLYIWYRLG